MKFGFNEDKTKARIGKKSRITYKAEDVEIPEFGTYLRSFTTPMGGHTLSNCVIVPMITSFTEDNTYHAVSVYISALTELSDGKIKIDYIVSDAGTTAAQYPFYIDVEFNLMELYGT